MSTQTKFFQFWRWTAAHSSKTSVPTYKPTWCHNPDDYHLAHQAQRPDNLYYQI